MLHRFVASIVFLGLAYAAGREQETAAPPASLRFYAADRQAFVFDTGVLRGQLRADGQAKGLTEVVHVPTGTLLSRSMGLMGHYRVFTTNRRYGTGAWDWPGDAVLQTDGSVEARWPATPERPFELRATYRWAAPNALDVVTSVRAQTRLPNFESFLASYFATGFTNAFAYVTETSPGNAEGRFLAAEPRFGTWLVFPRDDAVMTIVRDGRWTIPPSPVAWVQMPRLAQPLGVRRAPGHGLTAVIMAPPETAFALSMPQQEESHYSMYLSLWGRDVKAGETAQARARLVIGEQWTDAQVLDAYAQFLKTCAPAPATP
ncbi:MAG TPA: hypothetical protein PLT00_07770 [Verrucomicrobiota bacterium]|jgi:hypothetical protein|nr:hypothetical protein [Verrucomicrobiota bacterium]OQB92088.1 MAG: hypothetical protein BWX84_01112 [Verrucomicrobia bacterium ADurb.Bin118]HPY30035.1 hypothetical protein [Verrucomicrobiota bacterium]HQB16596.1 hypothetical protein [Verrucomicrobiota bacterium]